MNFPVPWRCLLPSEAADFMTYNNKDDKAILRELSVRTGAAIDSSSDRDTPKRLSDRIVTISGQAEQKEAACSGIILKLRKMQDLHMETDLGFFVLLIPAAAVPVIVGARGATIQEVIAASGAELSIGKENVMGMADTPVGIEGTAAQVVAAAASIHRVIQEMADRGRLQPSDFKYRPETAAASLASGGGMGMPEVGLPPREHDQFGGLDPTNNFRTKAKLIVDTATAGWLIGKGGRTIREMQENSGAFLHVLREEEAPPVLFGGARLVEICGRYERKLEGIQVVLRTADNMPGGVGPKETQILVPTPIVTPASMQEIEELYTVGVSAKECNGHSESIVTVAGPIQARIQACQAWMMRIDKAHMDGTVVALSVDGENVGRDGRPRREIREGYQGGPPQRSYQAVH